MSIKRIAAALRVSQSTASLWVRDVLVTDSAAAALVGSSRSGRAAAAKSWRAKNRVARVAAQERGRERARLGDGLHRSGCMLFWAEGSKKKNRVVFTNSDPEMLRVFVSFLTDCYQVPRERIALSVNCHLSVGLTIDQIHAWWLERLGLPRECLRRPTVDQISRASGQRGRLMPFGTAQIVVYSTELVQEIYGAIQEYAGIDRPDWLESDAARDRVRRPTPEERNSPWIPLPVRGTVG